MIKGRLVTVLLFVLVAHAQVLPYYKDVNFTSTGNDLRSELQKLLFKHKQISYSGVWSAFREVDEGIEGCPEGTERGVYSSHCWAESQQCGSYKKEGDCFNREHIWPKSWWGGFSQGRGAQTDLFELFPADGYVNNRRGNQPLGVVMAPIWYNSTNGSLLGECAALPGITCFEPPDLYKGQIARAYLYISTAYYQQFGCCNTDGVNNSNMKPWLLGTILTWHETFGVTPAELKINDEVYGLQGNRNPFIDYPKLARQIFH